jgi:hypothetical protein
MAKSRGRNGETDVIGFQFENIYLFNFVEIAYDSETLTFIHDNY